MFEQGVRAMPTRIVVANQAEARFYDCGRPKAPLQPAGLLENPEGRLHDRDFKSDRPGRVFTRAATGPGRRGAIAHHDTGGERRPRKQAAIVFARRIAADLTVAHRTHHYDRLVLIAAPAFLGVLRKALPASLRSAVAAEITKDVVGQPEDVLRSLVPPDALRTLR